MTVAAGTRLGPYEVLSSLGAGGMGEVYRARDTRLAREVALKVLPVEVASDASRLKRFEKEARAASALNHPNIVTIYDIGMAESVSYIAMERVEGKTLRELLFTGPLQIKKLLPIAAQIADGLARAHEAGIVHRDLKPENVMVTRDGLVKILDFGLAKLTKGSGNDEGSQFPTETGTSPGMVLGTVGYMSPEQAGGQPIDFRSDQFSLGSILYELATGKRAFHKGTAVDTLSAILHEEPRPLAEVNPETPAPLRWILERCLAKEPGERYASTRDLARDLAGARDHLSEAFSVSGRPGARDRSRLRLIFVGIAAAFVAVAAAALFVGKSLSRPTLLKFQQLTFRHGRVGTARFAPDGQTIVHGGAWDENPMEVFTTRPGSFESRPLGIRGWIASVSSAGEMALIRRGDTLSQAPLAGGAPRDLLENVQWADWAPDGKSLAVIRSLGGKSRVEFPAATLLYESSYRLDNLHVSPAGGLIAFREGAGRLSTGGGEIFLYDVRGRQKKPTGLHTSEFGWEPDGKALWFIAGGYGTGQSELKSMSLGGGQRTLASFPGTYQLDDISREGRLLVERLSMRGDVRGLAPGAARDRPLSWLDDSFAAALSSDGRTILINEASHGAIYLRGMDGSAAVLIGEGEALALSPDGKQVLAVRSGEQPTLVLLPKGAGETRTVPISGFESVSLASFLPDGKRALIGGIEQGHRFRLYVIELERGTVRAVSPEGVDGGPQPVSPDGRLAYGRNPEGVWVLYSLDAGATAQPAPIPGLRESDMPVGWSANSQSLFVQEDGEYPARVFRVHLSSGKRELFHEFWPSDDAGIWRSVVLVNPDGNAWVYSCSRNLSELYLVEGLR